MITETINSIVDSMSNLHQNKPGGFITDLEGLVRAAEVQTKGLDGKTEVKRVPVALREQTTKGMLSGVDINLINRLVPDQKKRCIVFFEALAAPATAILPESTIFSGRISLLCWFNHKGFNVPENRLQTILTARLLSAVKQASILNDSLLLTDLKPAGIVENNPTIYGAYSFSDQNSAYFSYPFGCFKLDFNLKLSLNESCSRDLYPISLVDCA